MNHSPGSTLRQAMDAGTVAAPGAFTGLVARAVRDAGFDACYVSGGATSAAAGVPDIGILTLDRFAQTVREIVDGSGLPVLADADTGFGEEEMVRRTVIEYARAGAAGLHLEDQVFPKRCGHLDGKTLIPADQAASKIAWAVRAAKDSPDPSFVICARTDAKGVEGFDAAVDRAVLYVEAGADMIFPEGLTSEDEFSGFSKALRERVSQRVYLLANMTEFGKTPMLPLSRFSELGYDLVIFPVSTLRIAMHAVTSFLTELKTSGSAEQSLYRMQSRKDLYELLGYSPGNPWEFNASQDQ